MSSFVRHLKYVKHTHTRCGPTTDFSWIEKVTGSINRKLLFIGRYIRVCEHPATTIYEFNWGQNSIRWTGKLTSNSQCCSDKNISFCHSCLTSLSMHQFQFLQSLTMHQRSLFLVATSQRHLFTENNKRWKMNYNTMGCKNCIKEEWFRKQEPHWLHLSAIPTTVSNHLLCRSRGPQPGSVIAPPIANPLVRVFISCVIDWPLRLIFQPLPVSESGAARNKRTTEMRKKRPNTLFKNLNPRTQ